jgi:pimeloyl-ACP methyl ester carboxylesterase
VRIDNPIYGETEGILDHVSVPNARAVLEHLAADPRLDPQQLHLHGMSLGANFAVRSAHLSRAASLTLICPPFQPSRYFRELPTLNLSALQHMTRRADLDDLVAFAHENDLARVAPELTLPVRIFHGGRDRTIPVQDGHDLAASVGGPVALTVYERDHHNCLEHIDEITALTLEFIADPVATCDRHVAVERIDTAPTQHVTDEEALLAGVGVPPRRRVARLPFHVPSLRPRPAG